ncbi:TonB-dependent receptor plug domain-containing protein [Psychroserpens luteolus]|uniref:TonB-dependent receptor plug domain-containing protein n=1 Tax=Psychroserpens luteolus TaxID=2855840 RepID=UPI001E564CC1|nr:TonB-dependent receptor plug domain-containing protein [Psychroserpens luteolus]MCD2258346.1 TonB-dependent receptor plug domain-containing protein [Psychroserpens luteolus]
MRRYILFLFFLVLSTKLYAQEHTFNYNNTPLIQVVKDIETRYNIRFSFNSSLFDGKRFSFSGNADLKTIIAMISQQSALEFQYINTTNIIVKPLYKEPEELIYINTLDEVLLVAEYLTSGFYQKKKDGSVTMRPDKLGILPGLTEPDVLQSLQLLPGISSPTESASNLHIRGGTPDQNLILLDGIKMYHEGHLFGMISPLNPYIIEQVDVYRSGASVKYGERIAGVIDMHMTETVPEKTTIGLGSNLLQADALVKTSLLDEKIGIIVSARRATTDLFDSPPFTALSNKVYQNTRVEEINDIVEEEELTILENDFYFTDLSTKVIFQPNTNHTFSVSALKISNRLDYKNEDIDNEVSSDMLELNNNGLSFHWNGLLTSDWKIDAELRLSDYTSKYDFIQSTNNVLEENFSKENNIKDRGALLQLRYKINEQQNISLGYDVTTADVSYNLRFLNEDDESFNESNNQSFHSIFGEYNFQSKGWYVRMGLRNSLFTDNQKWYIEPRLYTDYAFNNVWKVKASAEIKNQAISKLVSFEFNELGLDNVLWVLSDEDETPVLNNKQIAAGVLFSKNGWTADIEGYFKEIKGLTSLTKGFNEVSVDEERYVFGSSKIYGLDVLLKKRIKHFRTWVAYSLSKTDFKFKGIQDGSFPGNFDQRHIISWSNTYKYKQFQLSLGWSLASGKPYSNPSGIETFTNDIGETEYRVTFSDQNNKRLNTYHKLDASITYDFFIGEKKSVKARLGASVLNIYNQKNQIDKTFEIEHNQDDDPRLVEQTTIGLGITPNIVFRVNF